MHLLAMCIKDAPQGGAVAVRGASSKVLSLPRQELQARPHLRPVSPAGWTVSKDTPRRGWPPSGPPTDPTAAAGGIGKAVREPDTHIPAAPSTLEPLTFHRTTSPRGSARLALRGRHREG